VEVPQAKQAELDWDQVRGRRLVRNWLVEPASPRHIADVVRGVCGVQAQVASAAEWAVGVRVAQITQQDVRAALAEDRTVVKTCSIRGTLHLHPADELSLWMAAMRADEYWRSPEWLASERLTRAQSDDLLDAIGDALDGRCLTRRELAGEVAGRVGTWAREKLSDAWGSLLRPAAYTGRLCFGPPRGTEVTFVRADQWIGGWKELDPEDARLQVVRRYLASYGPVTGPDVARWLALRPPEGRALLKALGDELTEVSVAGKRAWILTAHLADDG
jgi:Winged helix DNA-binding domain